MLLAARREPLAVRAACVCVEGGKVSEEGGRAWLNLRPFQLSLTWRSTPAAARGDVFMFVGGCVVARALGRRWEV